MLDVRRMRVLREVAVQGSFSAAAEALSFTQSAVSQQIAALERETGTVLVQRSARGVRLTEVESRLEGEMDVRGCLGLDDEYRNGFTNIRVTFTVKGDAPDEKLREVVKRAQARSAVYDMVTHGVPVDVSVKTA